MRIKKFLAGLGIAGATALGVSACAGVAVEPSIGQYAFVTGHGALSSQQLNAVYGPGERRSAGNGSIVWYVPANQRNYITAQPGNLADRTNPQAVLTGTSGSGSNAKAGIPVNTYSFISWELNPAIDAGNGKVSAIADKFFKFCLKYGCATTQAQNDSSNQGLSHSSVPGWNDMLAETWPTAIDNASQTAASKFGPNLWTNRAEWAAYAKDIQDTLQTELRNLTGSGNSDYFCGPGSTVTKCTPLYVTVKNVVPQDPNAQSIYNQQVNASLQHDSDAARVANAKALYGPDAPWTLSIEDLINQCHSSGTTCNIYVGNAPTHP